MYIYTYICTHISLNYIYIDSYQKRYIKIYFNMQSIKNILKYAVLFCRTSVVGKQVLLAALV